MSGRRRGHREAHTPSHAQAAGQAVYNAEQFLRDAWKRELLRQCDHLRFALDAARNSAIDLGRARRALRAETNLLTRTSRLHSISSLAHDLEHDGSAITAQPPYRSTLRSGRCEPSW